MVEISLSGSGEGLGRAIARGYSTTAFSVAGWMRGCVGSGDLEAAGKLIVVNRGMAARVAVAWSGGASGREGWRGGHRRMNFGAAGVVAQA